MIFSKNYLKNFKILKYLYYLKIKKIKIEDTSKI